jgi:geranylgeranyl diphosphate synthase type II
MDDDDLRRGVPTCHVVFGEAVALLAGDALQALAFEVLASARPVRRYPVAEMVRELAAAAGSRQLVGGQVLDLEGEKSADRMTRAALRGIHSRKTAALLTASLRLGGMAADATPRQLAALTTFGRNLGLAFQVVDDILDVTATTEQLGKTAGKDAAVAKATYPSVFGLEGSRREAARLTRQAARALEPLGRPAARLRQLADHLLGRRS